MSTESAVHLYRVARKRLNCTPFRDEMTWQVARDLRTFTESDLLREAAWVILCSGFRESVVRTYFPFISLCFCDWESADLICDNAHLCKTTALSAFRNTQKIDAIVKTAAYVAGRGFENYRVSIVQDPILALRELPYIGQVTAFHLAKNLGLDVAKPDRHLSRLAAALGFEDAQHLCSAVAHITGDPVRLVDIVLWRFLAAPHGPRLPVDRQLSTGSPS